MFGVPQHIRGSSQSLERVQLQQAFSSQNTTWKIYFPEVVKNQVFSAVSLLRTLLFWGILEHLFQNGICGCLQWPKELEWGFMDRSLFLLVLTQSVRKCSVSAAENPKSGIPGQAGRDVPAPPAPSAPVGSWLSPPVVSWQRCSDRNGFENEKKSFLLICPRLWIKFLTVCAPWEQLLPLQDGKGKREGQSSSGKDPTPLKMCPCFDSNPHVAPVQTILISSFAFCVAFLILNLFMTWTFRLLCLSSKATEVIPK